MNCSMGEAEWFCADGNAWMSAPEACACQECSGHKWTHCRACGRAGDRAGDTNSPNTCALDTATDLGQHWPGHCPGVVVRRPTQAPVKADLD